MVPQPITDSVEAAALAKILPARCQAGLSHHRMAIGHSMHQVAVSAETLALWVAQATRGSADTDNKACFENKYYK